MICGYLCYAYIYKPLHYTLSIYNNNIVSRGVHLIAVSLLVHFNACNLEYGSGEGEEERESRTIIAKGM